MCFAPIPYELRKPGCYGQFPSRRLIRNKATGGLLRWINRCEDRPEMVSLRKVYPRRSRFRRLSTVIRIAQLPLWTTCRVAPPAFHSFEREKVSQGHQKSWSLREILGPTDLERRPQERERKERR